ncbi:helix-turn-helix domain-containing protein [Tabrizicola flagellatus]|uniref:helix-turn-helix domain-containing protein n=1 Tax=Tabrizicola flagellatus TaxID=2593021 RepID=UPI001F260658|nr:helix-turn-helix transcriptional regulator [Tabrizicola flagellatus]
MGAALNIPDDFAGRLNLAMKQANVSPAALASAVGVDKSVVSRWISGRVRPTQHNLSRISAVLAQGLPGFTVLAFEAPAAAFRALVMHGARGALAGSDHSLPIPNAILDAARQETALRGAQYLGFYRMFYRSFSRPRGIVRMATLLRPLDGLIEMRAGAAGTSFEGWALLLLNRVYGLLVEDRLEALAFLVLNAGQLPRARFITGVLSGPAAGVQVPSAAPVVLVRSRDLTGEAEADLARHRLDCAEPPLIDPREVPPEVLAVLDAPAEPGPPMLRVPFSEG